MLKNTEESEIGVAFGGLIQLSRRNYHGEVIYPFFGLAEDVASLGKVPLETERGLRDIVEERVQRHQAVRLDWRPVALRSLSRNHSAAHVL